MATDTTTVAPATGRRKPAVSFAPAPDGPVSFVKAYGAAATADGDPFEAVLAAAGIDPTATLVRHAAGEPLPTTMRVVGRRYQAEPDILRPSGRITGLREDELASSAVDVSRFEVTAAKAAVTLDAELDHAGRATARTRQIHIWPDTDLEELTRFLDQVW